MSEENFPDFYLKGAPNKDFYDQENGIMSYSALEHWEASPNNEGYDESSINWNDNDGAVLNLKEKQKTSKNGGEPQKQFVGCFKLSTKILQSCINKYPNILDCERRPLADNQYHGNILLKRGELKKYMGDNCIANLY